MEIVWFLVIKAWEPPSIQFALLWHNHQNARTRFVSFCFWLQVLDHSSEEYNMILVKSASYLWIIDVIYIVSMVLILLDFFFKWPSVTCYRAKQKQSLQFTYFSCGWSLNHCSLWRSSVGEPLRVKTKCSILDKSQLLDVEQQPLNQSSICRVNWMILH